MAPVASRAQAAQGIARPNLRSSTLDPEPFVILIRGPCALVTSGSSNPLRSMLSFKYSRHLACANG